MSLIFPFFSFLCGLFAAQLSLQNSASLKNILSKLLARLFIPIVIIYNLVFYKAGSFSLMLFSFFVSIFLFYLYLLITKQKLQALCFSYVNMAWLGFPLAIALFGPSISPPMVAIYVGGSIFGNIWSVTALSAEKEDKLIVIRKVILSPPVVAIFIAIILILFGIKNVSWASYFEPIYSAAKIGMSFSGMCILGMWLRKTKVSWFDIRMSINTAIFKVIIGVVICFLTFFFIPIPHIEKYIGVMFLLFCLPPAANIVALETHYLGTGTSAKYIASGTIVSCIFVAVYGLFLHLILPLF